MTEYGQDLGLQLPSIAEAYAQATRRIRDAGRQEVGTPASGRVAGDVETVDAGPGQEATAAFSEALGPIYPKWIALRDAVRRNLATTSGSLAVAGLALDGDGVELRREAISD
ncbi:MAG: hypothetical protein ACRDXX_07310 [Stackebrandtia sp.]